MSLIQERLDLMAKEQIQDTHWMPAEHSRRIEDWMTANSIVNFTNGASPDCYPMFRFFQENHTEIFELEFNGENFEMFESMRIYIERDGRPYNYLSSVDDLNKKREVHLQVEED